MIILLIALNAKALVYNKNKRIFKDISSKVERDQNDRIAELKEESRKIVSKVRQGDLKTIENIYGT